MATTTAPNQNVIVLKRKNNRPAHAACAESFCLPYSAKQQREIAELEVLITCVKAGPRRRDLVKECGVEEFLCRYNGLKCYLGKSHVEKHVLENGPTRPPPPTGIRDVHNGILVKAVEAGELVPK